MSKLRKEWVDGYLNMTETFTVMGVPDTELDERELRAALRHAVLARVQDKARSARNMQLIEALERISCP